MLPGLSLSTTILCVRDGGKTLVICSYTMCNLHDYRVKLYDGLLDLPGYFEKHVWTGYMRDFKIACNAHKDGSISK